MFARITEQHLRAAPWLCREAIVALVELQPATVLEALRMRHVGRRTTRMLLELGLVTDPERVQTRSLAAASKQLGRVL